jgi:hypothetical protein
MMEKRENASNKEREKRQLPDEEIDDIEIERKPRDRSSIAINNGLSFFVYYK